ncbi:hypothetical protein [Bradyrhizobium yuanmingense]|uniref:hypothetical protein n=1 Tax=Bradyrhizobium yuanmingense TaxID=108015 RepID=UPI00187D32A8|nr:hypothetical protein [Bradyrhizobium yuanmingense]
MDRKPFASMSLEELWRLRAIINDVLAEKLAAKKQELEQRLELLNREGKAPN